MLASNRAGAPPESRIETFSPSGVIDGSNRPAERAVEEKAGGLGMTVTVRNIKGVKR